MPPPDPAPPPSPPCFLDGRYLPLAEARVSPLDRGFLFGDGVYEVVKVLGGRLLFLEEHLARLRRSLAAVAIPPPDTGAGGLAAILAELVRRAALGDGSIYLQVTRGAGPREKVPPPGMVPTVFAYPLAHPHPPHASRPLRAIVHPDLRWGRCDVKSVSLMATVLGKLAVREAAADEVIFAGPGGALREGGSTNLLVRRGDRLWTHPEGPAILPGVTRAVLLELARRQGWEVVEEPPRLAERSSWQEAMLCGTLTGVQPLAELDGEPLPTGGVDAWTERLGRALEAWEAHACCDLC